MLANRQQSVTNCPGANRYGSAGLVSLPEVRRR